MAERNLVIDHLKFSYEGLFNVNELYTVISSWFFEKGWDWYEKMNQEQVTPSGKQIRIIFEPWKSITDYYKIAVRIKFNLIDVKEMEVEHEGETLHLSHGVVRIIFDGYVVSDRQDQWSKKPFYWFLSLIFDKYLFKSHFEKAETWIKSDVDDLYDKIKTYLNTFKYTYQQ